MRRTSKTLCYCLCLLAALAFTNTQAQQVFKTTKKSVIGFLEYLPSDYKSNSKKYPIVIFLHGLGEKGNRGTDPKELEKSINKVAVHGPAKHVKKGTKFPFILISPQLKGNYGDWSSAYVMEVLDYVKTYLRVDEKRIYLTGLSLGGGGTWTTAQDYPKVFAAIAPVCGSRNSTSKACGIANEDMPVWAFHGDKDNVVPYSRSVKMVNAINACSPKVRAKLTTYPGVKHNSWDKAYDPSHKIHNPNVYDWMLNQVNGEATEEKTNKAPTANADSDQTITLPANSITLTGSGSDSDGSVASYNWVKVEGGNATLEGETTNKLTVSGLVAGTYKFKLTVKDDDGVSKTDEVIVRVEEATKNIDPTVNAGADKTITLPVNSVNLVGTGADEDGKIASYNWAKVEGGNATLEGETTNKLTVSGLVTGTYKFKLTIKDDDGASKSDEITVTVKGADKNIDPIVNAGADKTITLPVNSVDLVGTGTDEDGKIASYTWTKVYGGNAKLSGSKTKKLKVAALVKGNYVFRLTVKDDKGASKSDDVAVIVKDAITKNVKPEAIAGVDKTITLPANSLTLFGSGKDSDGRIASYNWTKVSGGNVSLANVNTAALTLTKLVKGNYVFRFTVKDDKGDIDTDDVTVTVKEAPKSKINKAPMANAGTDHVIKLPTNKVTLLGSGSDSDGSIVSYTWAKIRGGNATLSGANTPTLAVSDLEAGIYYFQLVVKDDKGATHLDKMMVIVEAGNSSKTVTSAISSEKEIQNHEAMNEEAGATQAEPLLAAELGEVQEAAKYDLTSQDESLFKDCAVVIFDESLQRVYSGRWNQDSYQQVFNKTGLYYFNVMRGGRKVGAGKIYIR